jgi:LytS/YehU family sensor histidine kinase
LLSWLPWALATPWVMREVRSQILWPWNARSGLGLLRHAGIALIIGAAAGAWAAALQTWLNPWYPDMAATPWLPAWREKFVGQLLSSFILCAGIAITTAMLDARQRLAQQQVAAAQLAEQLTHARLRALQHQIEPHFLFNTLNGISGMVRSGEADAAADMIARLSDFLRTMLHEAQRHEVSLGEELALTRSYLQIQRMRYGDRLYTIERVEDSASGARVPVLILQPLVENAVKHGIDRLAHGGIIEIEARRSGTELWLDIRNDGPPLRPGAPKASSVGLANVRARLRALYGEAASVELINAEGGGVIAALRMPWTEAAHG